ncbi:MAG: putative toxin-antitoxin system toxin component, PIN family [Desulfotignum sp.]|nr:putative toxin-antitoxin system toxin component, PIN family [Desulfotignum sp.]
MISRVVLDSNVIISGFLFGGPPARLIEHIVNGTLHGFTSLPILDEVREVVLQRPKFGLSPEQALCFVEELYHSCTLVKPGRRIRAIQADPDDDMILECASEANADLIISGDLHLLDLGSWEHIQILSPTNALREIETQRKNNRLI